MNSRIGVYICHCGSNIADVIDVEVVKKSISLHPKVVLIKTMMFACADSSQNEIINDIRNNQIDALVIASCSPKLHLFTFRSVAERAGLNYNQYVQVNIREQGSWAHGDKPKQATQKAIRLTKMAIAKVQFLQPLHQIEIQSEKAVLVVGAGVSGLRAALELANMDFSVYLVEKKPTVGGHIIEWEHLFLNNQSGKDIVSGLLGLIKKHENIHLFTNSTIIQKTGSIGNFEIKIKKSPNSGNNGREIVEKEETFSLKVGAILLTTGFDHYKPKTGEYGYNTIENVITLPEFKKIVESNNEELIFKNQKIKNIAYIYCVGSRQTDDDNKYCSRYCCTAAIDTAILASEKFKGINNFHYNRGIRTYGKQEIMYHRSSENGDVYLQFDEDNPLIVERHNKTTIVKVNDILTEGKELELEADLVVLVTGMVHREYSDLLDVLKVPVGRDSFFNEVHPKLRPVETVLEGIYIAGCCQGPKNITESVKSSLSAASKISGLLWKGQIELEPIQAEVDAEACEWCGLCAEMCAYDAISKVKVNSKYIAEVNITSCKGCGMCVPVCESNAINLLGYSDKVIESMIDALVE